MSDAVLAEKTVSGSTDMGPYCAACPGEDSMMLRLGSTSTRVAPSEPSGGRESPCIDVSPSSSSEAPSSGVLQTQSIFFSTQRVQGFASEQRRWFEAQARHAWDTRTGATWSGFPGFGLGGSPLRGS
jgi:hypothetical protein